MNGSRHLEFLVDKNLLNPISVPELEHLYDERAGHVLNGNPTDTTSAQMDGQDEDRILLTMPDAKQLASILQAPELALEAERAIVQVGEQLQAQKEKAKEAKEAKEADEKKSS